MAARFLDTCSPPLTPSVSRIPLTEDPFAIPWLSLIQSVDRESFADAIDPRGLREAIASTLAQVCETTDWDYGEVWLPSDNSTLELSQSYIASNTANLTSLEQFQACSEGFVVSLGEGLPGRVWLSGSEFIADPTAESESYCLRNQIAKAFDINAGFGLAIAPMGEIRAVVVFFQCGIKADNPAVFAN